MFNKLQNKVNQLKLYYLLVTLISLGGIFSHATYYIYLTTQLGFSNSQAMFLDTVLFIGIFVLEVPTGIIGDIFGRKFSFIIGRILIAIHLLIYFFVPNYKVLVFGSALYALGRAFESGSFEAWIVDQVKKQERTKIFSSKDIIWKFGEITIPIISIFIAERTSYGFPYLISFLFATITTIVGIVFMKEQKAYREKNTQEKRGLELLIATGKDSIKSVSQNVWLRSFVLSILFTSLGFIAVFSYTSKLIEITLGSKYIGVVISLSSLASIIFTYTLNKLNLTKSFALLGFLGSTAVILIGIIKNPTITIVGLMLQVMLMAVFEIQRQTKINNLIKKNRATTLSVFSLVASISGVFGTLFFGYLADKFDIPFTFLVGGLCILVGVLLVPKRKSKNKT